MHVNFLTCGLIVEYIFCSNFVDFSIQESWQDFGIDFEGPVPLDDENPVVVEELPQFLSQEEMITLHPTTRQRE